MSSNKKEEKKKNKDKEMKSSDNHHADVVQDADQFAGTSQESNELIFIKDSCNICVQTTDTQAAVSLQVGLQLAIALVIRITIGDSDKGQNVVQDLLQHFDSEQSNKQKIIIENSKDINVITTDTDVAVNIQALLQVLVSLVAKLDIL
ncbi:spore coat protein [Neobacillus drentensis]|uniref:spore coat protein n=1 Tax=Neobacillus drentensis TaxID=220684 RepID=UPI002FFE690D